MQRLHFAAGLDPARRGTRAPDRRMSVDALEFLAHAHRPGERHRGHAQHALDFVEQVERLAHFAVELVDEREDRRAARRGTLEQA